MDEKHMPRMLIVPRRLARTAPLEINGISVLLDPTIPPDEIQMRDAGGKVLARAIVPREAA